MRRKTCRAIACHEVSTHTLPQLRTAGARRIIRVLKLRRLARALAFLDKVNYALSPSCTGLTRASRGQHYKQNMMGRGKPGHHDLHIST
jgi:hypothetical protein